MSLNAGRVDLLDDPILEQQLLGLVWRGGRIDHPVGEHDDAANAAVIVVAALEATTGFGTWEERKRIYNFGAVDHSDGTVRAVDDEDEDYTFDSEPRRHESRFGGFDSTDRDREKF